MELKLRSDTKRRKWRFTAKHFAHPAKMHLGLCEWLIDTYTKPGDVILDPMAGSGTLLVACSMGRNVVLVELEDKFIDMMAGYDCDGQIIGYTEVEHEEVEAGWVIDVGDGYWYSNPFPTKQEAEEYITSGQLKSVLGEDEDQIEIRYQEAEPARVERIPQTKCGKTEEHAPHRVQGNWERVQEVGAQLGCEMGQAVIKQGDARELEGVSVDCVISSPPYSEMVHKGSGEWSQSPDGKMVGVPQGADYTASKDNISNLPYGQIDAVITSPPYEEAMGKKHHSPRADKLAQEKSNPVTYTERVDAVITSPPYERSLTAESGDKGWDKLAEDPTSNRYGRKSVPSVGAEYSSDVANIGNLKADSYLEAMLQVYQQCHKCLKPDGGLMILVTKNFIRDKQIVPLDEHTIKLCEQAGFQFVERHYRKLMAQSFWRTIYYQKFPDAPRIDQEDVLVFRR